MICNLWIEFQAGKAEVDALLRTMEDAGFQVHGMRLIPGGGGRRSTLTVDIADCGDRPAVAELERSLLEKGALTVIHTSEALAAPA